MRLPSGVAAAMPMLMFFLRMIRSPSTEALTPGKSRSALATASMKKGVNVSFSPVLAWNSALLRLRQSTTRVTSASTKEVTCGLVCTLRTM